MHIQGAESVLLHSVKTPSGTWPVNAIGLDIGVFEESARLFETLLVGQHVAFIRMLLVGKLKHHGVELLPPTSNMSPPASVHRNEVIEGFEVARCCLAKRRKGGSNLSGHPVCLRESRVASLTRWELL
jgi:hypothetical protein